MVPLLQPVISLSIEEVLSVSSIDKKVVWKANFTDFSCVRVDGHSLV